MPPPLISRRINNVRIRRINRRPVPTAAPPPPHKPLSNPADQLPPSRCALTSSIPSSASPSPHHRTDKFHRHKKRCAASYSHLLLPTRLKGHSDQALPTQSNTILPY